MGKMKEFLIDRLLRKRLACRFRWLIRHEQNLLAALPYPPARIPLTCREAHETDLPGFLEFVEPQLLPELSERLRQGHSCFAAYHQDRAVGFTWLNPNRALETTTGIQFPLKPGEIFSYHKLIHPDYRNQGVSPRLDWERDRILAAKGFRHRISMIDRNNQAALRTAEKAGVIPVRHLIFIQALGLRMVVSRPIRKAKRIVPTA